MTLGGVRLAAPSLRRLTPQITVLLLLAAVAWVLTVRRVVGMGGQMAGTASLALPAFLVMWALMMAAMMLPSVAPLASMYSRSVRHRRALRLTSFALGYLLVWVLVGVPAYGVARGAAALADDRPGLATWSAVGAFALCGVYQLTSFKERCLRHCRSPLSLLLHYGSYRGRSRDLAVGLHHGAYCAGCCWALFLLLLAFGMMNLPAMVVLAGVVLIEKNWSHGQGFARFTGVVALCLAVVVVWVPSLAPGLSGSSMGG